MTVNQRVTGSSPVSGANTNKGFKELKPLLVLSIRHNSDTRRVYIIFSLQFQCIKMVSKPIYGT